MQLRRCSCQDGVPIERHFARQEDVMTDAKSMRSLLAKLASADFECTVFTLTSVDRVCLLSQDDYSTPWWVIITSFPEEEFKIECRIPRSIRPWLSATLVSEESSADEACATVIRALQYSRIQGVPSLCLNAQAFWKTLLDKTTRLEGSGPQSSMEQS